MSNLSELLPSGGGQNVVSMTATGAITEGQPVALKSDGTVTTISTTGASNAQSLTYVDKEVFESAATYGIRTAYGNGSFVTLYNDNANSNYWTVVAGTVDSSGNITLGTPLVVHSVGGSLGQGDIIYHSTSQKFVVVWSNASGSSYGKVITASGTSLSAGSIADIITGDTTGYYSVRLEYDSYIDRVIGLLNVNGTCNPVILEISGTSITRTLASTFSLGFSSTQAAYLTSCFDTDTNQVIFAHRMDASTIRAYALTFTTSDVSVGAATDVSDGSCGYLSLTYDTSQNKALLIYLSFTGSDTNGVVYTVSGTSLTAGSVTQLSTDNMEFLDTLYNPDSNVTVLSGRNDTQSGYIYSMSVSISGTTPVVDNFGAVDGSTSVRETGHAYDTVNQYIIAAVRDDGNSDYGTAITYKPHGTVAGTNVADCLGIASAAIANSAAGDINVFGGIATSSSFLAQTFSFASSTQNTLRNGTHYNHAACFDSTNNKIVLAYDDGADNTTKAVVCTVSGGTMTFGTPVQVHGSRPNNIDIAFDSNAGKVVIVYRDAGNSYGATAIVGTVSGTSISFGSSVAVDTSNSRNPVVCYDAYAQKVLVAYGDQGNSTYGTGRVGTISGDSISFGTETVFASVNTYPAGIAYDSVNQKCAIVYYDTTNNVMKSVVASISGTSVSFGSATQIQNTLGSTGINSLSTETVTYDSTAGAIVYVDSDTSTGSFAYAGTISGTSITFGSQAVLNADTSPGYYHGVAHDSNSGKTLAFFAVDGGSEYNEMTISGTTISLGTNKTLDSNPTDRIIAVTDTNLNKIVAFYVADSGDVVSEVFTGTGSATPLTVGSNYYAQSDGTISTTSTSPAVLLGQAISTTTINMRNLT